MAISPSPFDRLPRRRQRSPFAFVLAALVLVLVVLVVIFRPAASSLLWQVMAPILRVREALGAGEAERLRQALASSTAALADRKLLYEENRELKARLGRSDAGGARILAAVLQSPPWTPYDTLVIDAGEAEGVAVGDYVSAGGQTRIGRVSEVYVQSARVELMSAPGASYQALLHGTLPVAVEGQGGGSMRALVPVGSEVRVGDTVSFPGLFGAVAAHVSAVEERAGESFIVVYMHLPVNPGALRFVEVQKP